MAIRQSPRRAAPFGRSLVRLSSGRSSARGWFGTLRGSLVAACVATVASPGCDDGREDATSGPTSATTTVGATTGSETTTDPESSSTTGGSTTVVGTSSNDDDSSTTDEGGSAVTGLPPPPKFCSLADVDPLADPKGQIDMGDGEGQIPGVIGEALLRNCGCHYTEAATENGYIDYISDTVLMRTLDDFHVPFEGTFPMGYDDRPVYEAVAVRVVEQKPVPMPSIECDVEGEPGVITAADRALFADWLGQAAPDGASYLPPDDSER